MTDREDARDRLLLSISEALKLLLCHSTADSKTANQIVHNLEGCNKNLLAASGIGHGRPSDWKDYINAGER